MELKKTELLNIHGGGFGFGIIIAAGIAFLIGVIDGIIRPLKCN